MGGVGPPFLRGGGRFAIRALFFREGGLSERPSGREDDGARLIDDGSRRDDEPGADGVALSDGAQVREARYE